MKDSNHLAFVLGTRPEIIKLAPVIHETASRSVPYVVIHTGQHYSENLDEVFFKQLDLPSPEYNLQVGSKSHGAQTGEMLKKIEDLLIEERPTAVLVQGDTNSVLAGAIATSKLEPDLGHIEAGLRSFDRRMPEETNRVVTDHVSDFLFAPTEESKQNLLREGISETKITVTGNTVVDALYRHRELAAEKSSVLQKFGATPNRYFLMTAHRQENVDDRQKFKGLLDGVSQSASAQDARVLYPIHPRAEKRLAEFEIEVPDEIETVEPLDYLDFLKLQANAALILTDSGGVQEEACVLGVPCVTLRENTERPETVSAGANMLSGYNPERIVSCVNEMLHTDRDWENPFGNGNASKRILDVVS